MKGPADARIEASGPFPDHERHPNTRITGTPEDLMNDRLQSMSVVLSRELNERPPKDWEPIMQNTGTAYHLRKVAQQRNPSLMDRRSTPRP